MAQLAGRITPDAGRTVLDKTGLGETRYFCAATFSSLSAQAPDTTAEPGAADLFRASNSNWASNWNRPKEPLEILIVDHAERVPTEN